MTPTDFHLLPPRELTPQPYSQVYARLDIVERALNDMRVRTVLEQKVEELMTTKVSA